MVRIHCLDPEELQSFLERRPASAPLPQQLNLSENLVEVLRKANEFVPSDAGSILIDGPVLGARRLPQGQLTFIAVFGDGSEDLLGRAIPDDQGVAGHVYRTGLSFCTPDVRSEAFFDRAFDSQSAFETHSLVAIPIRIGQRVCGVLELLNRRRADTFSQEDQNLLEIFADYISISVQNVLDGRLAQEIAIRDNLTGLYNDRSLHQKLTAAIESCRREESDLSLLFLDLDFFKRVNDSHGHLAGSQVLKEVGRVLHALTAEHPMIAARYGGDEFVLAAPGLGLDQGIDLAESIRSEIEFSSYCDAPSELQPEALHLLGITCSIGVASLHRHTAAELSPDRCKATLLRLADAAMYVAKESGRNRTAVAGEVVTRRRRHHQQSD